MKMEWKHPIFLLTLLLILSGIVTAGGASYATYPCENETICTQADLHKSNGNLYASVILNNSVDSIGGKLRLKDCDLFDCRVLLQITPAQKITIKSDDTVAGWFQYNHDIVEYYGAVLWNGTAWEALDETGKIKLEKDTTYFFGLDYHKKSPSDAVDLVPQIFGVDITRWAWWNSTWWYRTAYNLSNTGSNLTDYQMMFTVDLNETISTGTNMRWTWYNTTSGTEQSIPFWRSTFETAMHIYGDILWSTANANGTVWARIPEIPAGTNTSTVYLYYTAMPQTDLSNGTTTFFFWEPCDSQAAINSRWTNISNGLVASTYCLMQSVSAQVNTTTYTSPATHVLEWAWTMSGTAPTGGIGVDTNGHQFSTMSGYEVRNAYINASGQLFANMTLGAQTVMYQGAYAAEWYSYKFSANATHVVLARNGSILATNASTQYRSGYLNVYFTYGAGVSVLLFLDNMRDRAYANPEPTYAAGVSETLGGFYATNGSCSAATTQMAKIYFIDEQTNGNVSANASIVFNSTTDNSTWTIASNTTFVICKSNLLSNFSVNVSITYSNTTSTTRYYTEVMTNTTNETFNLYLLNNSAESYITFWLKNQYNIAQPGRTLVIYRVLTNGTVIHVTDAITDGTGYANNVPLYVNGSSLYNIVVTYNGGTEYTFNSTTIACYIGWACSQTLIINIGDYYTFNVITSYNVPLENVSLSFYTQVSNTTWVLNQSLTTDATGSATAYLQRFVPVILVATRTGYIPLNTTITPALVTYIALRLYSSENVSIPGYANLWNTTLLYFNAPMNYQNQPCNVTFQVIDLNSSTAINFYGMIITRFYNGTTYTALNSSVVTPSNGGLINYTTGNGTNVSGRYVVNYWFDRDGRGTYNKTMMFYCGNNTGMSMFDPSTIFSPWSYVFLALVITMIVTGFVSRYTFDGAAVIGLLILWGFTVMWPSAVIADSAGLTTPFWLLTTVTTLVVFLAYAYKVVF